MASVNKVIIVGNLGRDPEVRYSNDGASICSISVATASQWKDKNSGERREETEWHRVVFYGRLAEIAGEYLKKGRSVYLEGRLKTNKWTDGQGVERYSTQIVADQMQMLGGNGGDDKQTAPQREEAPQADAAAPAPKRGRASAKANKAAEPAPSLADLSDDTPF